MGGAAAAVVAGGIRYRHESGLQCLATGEQSDNGCSLSNLVNGCLQTIRVVPRAKSRPVRDGAFLHF
ncbi:hypothetical protein D2Q93_02585 [Alicyclobacillaceae bacterium I2511]|nr:hypothetical protein D2Q93_02585 [Alicyclobacillaceae bacterium I2511]